MSTRSKHCTRLKPHYEPNRPVLHTLGLALLFASSGSIVFIVVAWVLS